MIANLFRHEYRLFKVVRKLERRSQDETYPLSRIKCMFVLNVLLCTTSDLFIQYFHCYSRSCITDIGLGTEGGRKRRIRKTEVTKVTNGIFLHLLPLLGFCLSLLIFFKEYHKIRENTFTIQYVLAHRRGFVDIKYTFPCNLIILKRLYFLYKTIL